MVSVSIIVMLVLMKVVVLVVARVVQKIIATEFSVVTGVVLIQAVMLLKVHS